MTRISLEEAMSKLVSCVDSPSAPTVADVVVNVTASPPSGVMVALLVWA